MVNRSSEMENGRIDAMLDYRTLNNSKFLLLFHTIFVCKYRTIETDVDHLHLLINSVPKLSPLSIVRRLKSISTHRLWINNSQFLRKHFWKEDTFWSDGYFVSSIGNASEETIRKYIESQG